MKLAKLTLGIAGVVFTAHGLACLIYPDLISLETHLQMPGPRSVMEVRAEYGGLPIALGILFLLGAKREEYLRTSLTTLLVVASGYLAARIIGASLAPEIDIYNIAALAYEGPMFVLAVTSWVLVRREALVVAREKRSAPAR